MAENSAIAKDWWDFPFNPWWGCTKVSDGCKNCYAESMARRFGGNNVWGPQGIRKFQSDKYWAKPIAWNTRAKKLGIRLKVFCGSMCDVFEDREDLVEPRTRLFNLINHTRQLDWLLLTKRPQNIQRFIERDAIGSFGINVWLGTSIEDQDQDWRLDELLKVDAKVHFVSCEPLLEDIILTPYLYRLFSSNGQLVANKISWVIVGGESGPKKRPFDPEWARFIKDECRAAGTPFYMKQIDKVQPIPDDLMIREFPNV